MAFDKPVRVALTRETLIRECYRTLVNTGRSYGAFQKEELLLVERLKDRGELLDPMSGYGLLAQYCSRVGLNSYSLEYNYPQYLWQKLCAPQTVEAYTRCCDALLGMTEIWPTSNQRAVVSDDWFHPESLSLLQQLLHVTEHASKSFFLNWSHENALALIVPFAGRLACRVPGDISTHTKKGGMCVYREWKDDFAKYLMALKHRLSVINTASKGGNHTSVFGDARYTKLPENHFVGMVTSPPYPNHRDFVTMFTVEHAFINLLGSEHGIVKRGVEKDVIGTNFINAANPREPKSKSANIFLDNVARLNLEGNARYDDEVYYVPYFKAYFCDLEDAYRNVSTSLAHNFEGFLTVVNNTHRNIVVPVADVIKDIWKDLGFESEFWSEVETFHIGTKNPRARGLRAKHTEYIVRVWR